MVVVWTAVCSDPAACCPDPLFRALVQLIRHTVAIVVGLGAAVVVTESVHVLGFVRTGVRSIRHAVLIVVGIGAAIGVLKPILVLRLSRALIGACQNAVSVRVIHRARRWRPGYSQDSPTNRCSCAGAQPHTPAE